MSFFLDIAEIAGIALLNNMPLYKLTGLRIDNSHKNTATQYLTFKNHKKNIFLPYIN